MPPISRFRQVYNIFGVYAGPAPAFSGHWSNYNDIKFNAPTSGNIGIFDNNLIRPLDRVFNLDYGFTISRENVTQLGVRGLTKRVIVNKPEIQLNFDYYIAGVRNENKLGFNVNYLDIENNPIYTEDVSCITNFTGEYTDSRNIFVAICPDNDDLDNRVYDIVNYPSGSIRPQDLFVYGFGNCYLNSYRVQASVGSIPQASVSYVCNNLMAYSSGSGASIPAVYSKSGNIISDIKFTIPGQTTNSNPTVIRPSDIDVNILQYKETPYNVFTGLYLFNLSTNLYNKIYVSGFENNEHIAIEDGLNLSTGIESGIFSGIFLYNSQTNDYNRIFSSGINGNQHLVVFSGITGVQGSGGVFSSLFLKNITNNKQVQVSSSGNYNDETMVIYSPTGDPTIRFWIDYPIDATFGTNSYNIPIQSFNLNLNLQREDLRSIGYVFPLDRKINFPVFVDFSFSNIVDNNQTGNLPDLLRQDKDYDILVNMYNHTCSTTGREIGIQYKIMGAKLENINYTISTNNKLMANFSFIAEIDINNKHKNLFISGLLNEPWPEYPYEFLRLESNKTGFLYTEDNNLIIL